MTNNLDPRYNLDNYKKGYNGYFNNVLDDEFPHYYYKKIINSWKQKRLDELQNNELLKDRYNLCEWYIGLIAQFMTQTVRAFKSIKEYYENQHAYSAQELRARSNHPRIEISNLIRLVEVDLMNYEDSIRLNKIEGNLRSAYSLQQFVLTITGNAIKTLKHPLQINVDRTPLYDVIENYLTAIKNTIIPEEIRNLDTLQNNYSGVLDASESSHTNDINDFEKKIKNSIEEEFNKIGGWNYVFFEHKDYLAFKNMLCYYFKSDKHITPSNTITIKKRTKTTLGAALGRIHKRNSDEGTLKASDGYIRIVKLLSEFQNDPPIKINRALSRHGDV